MVLPLSPGKLFLRISFSVLPVRAECGYTKGTPDIYPFRLSITPSLLVYLVKKGIHVEFSFNDSMNEHKFFFREKQDLG